jgi:cobalt-zinc-cadmium efflux system outer membrane protein
VLLLAATCAVAGAAGGEHRSFTLQQAVEHSLTHNGELRAARGDKEVARAGVLRAGLYPNPTLELEGVTGALTGSSDESSISVGLSQEFVTGGKRAKRLQVAEREAEAVHWQLVDRERLLALEVKIVFHEYLLAQQRRENAQRSVELSQRLLTVARERFAAGDIPELEVNLARVEAASSEGRLIAAGRALGPARARLLTLLGLAPGDEASFATTPEEPPLAAGIDDLRRLALANRPDLKALEAAQTRGEAEFELARAEQMPNVTAGLFYSHERRSDATGTAEEKVRDNLLGIRLSLPLPFFDRNQAGIHEAGARKSSVGTRLAFSRATVTREVEAEFASLMAAEQSYRLYAQEILPQSEENMNLVQEAYSIGETGILNVIEEQKKFVAVHDGSLEVLYARKAARARLEAAVGGPFETSTTGGAQ